MILHRMSDTVFTEYTEMHRIILRNNELHLAKDALTVA